MTQENKLRERIKSVVRKNIIKNPNYTPYCGSTCSKMPRTFFNGKQFECPCCGWQSNFEEEFINKHRNKTGGNQK